MNSIKLRPPPSLPEPLRGIEQGSFAEYTVKVRLKDIGQRILQENRFSSERAARLQSLLDDLPLGHIRFMEDRHAPDFREWRDYVRPFVGQNWLEVPWFFAETYFYRRILEAIDYYSEAEDRRIDPYAHQKRQGLTQYTPAIKIICAQMEQRLAQRARSPQDALVLLPELLLSALWGNQADLSMWPVGETRRQASETGTAGQHEHQLVINDLQAVSAFFEAHQLDRIDVILDNCGLELLNDLLLAEFLIASCLVQKIYFHAKSHPTFVSDAMPKDVMTTVSYLATSDDPCLRSTGERLQVLLHSGKLTLTSAFYWTSPLAFWEAPKAVLQFLEDTDLLIVKGDANYRRLLGDRHWAFDLPTVQAFGYLPKPLLALRVCKSEVIVGLQPGQPEGIANHDPNWMVNGRWGLVQFYSPSSDEDKN